MTEAVQSEKGYWNTFLPIFDYRSLDAYIQSMEYYIRAGELREIRELYYPVRLKPKGENSLANLKQGVDHIELRMLDLNPFSPVGISKEDMCEIFCSMSTDKRNIKPYLKEFFTHSDKHPHGWGLACLDDHDNIDRKGTFESHQQLLFKASSHGRIDRKGDSCPHPICHHWKCGIYKLSSFHKER